MLTTTWGFLVHVGRLVLDFVFFMHVDFLLVYDSKRLPLGSGSCGSVLGSDLFSRLSARHWRSLLGLRRGLQPKPVLASRPLSNSQPGVANAVWRTQEFSGMFRRQTRLTKRSGMKKRKQLDNVIYF